MNLKNNWNIFPLHGLLIAIIFGAGMMVFEGVNLKRFIIIGPLVTELGVPAGLCYMAFGEKWIEAIHHATLVMFVPNSSPLPKGDLIIFKFWIRVCYFIGLLFFLVISIFMTGFLGSVNILPHIFGGACALLYAFVLHLFIFNPVLARSAYLSALKDNQSI